MASWDPQQPRGRHFPTPTTETRQERLVATGSPVKVCSCQVWLSWPSRTAVLLLSPLADRTQAPPRARPQTHWDPMGTRRAAEADPNRHCPGATLRPGLSSPQHPRVRPPALASSGASN